MAVKTGTRWFAPHSDWPNEKVPEELGGWPGEVIGTTAKSYLVHIDDDDEYKFERSSAKTRALTALHVIKHDERSEATVAKLVTINGKGQGVVASRYLPKYTRIGVYPGRVYKENVWDRLQKAGALNNKYAIDFFELVDGRLKEGHVILDPSIGKGIDPQFKTALAPRLNEPTGPQRLANCSWVYNLAKSPPTLEVWTDTDVQIGTELTLCYGDSYPRSWQTTCQSSPPVRMYLLPGYRRPVARPGKLPVIRSTSQNQGRRIKISWTAVETNNSKKPNVTKPPPSVPSSSKRNASRTDNRSSKKQKVSQQVPPPPPSFLRFQRAMFPMQKPQLPPFNPQALRQQVDIFTESPNTSEAIARNTRSWFEAWSTEHPHDITKNSRRNQKPSTLQPHRNAGKNMNPLFLLANQANAVKQNPDHFRLLPANHTHFIQKQQQNNEKKPDLLQSLSHIAGLRLIPIEVKNAQKRSEMPVNPSRGRVVPTPLNRKPRYLQFPVNEANLPAAVKRRTVRIQRPMSQRAFQPQNVQSQRPMPQRVFQPLADALPEVQLPMPKVNPNVTPNNVKAYQAARNRAQYNDFKRAFPMYHTWIKAKSNNDVKAAIKNRLQKDGKWNAASTVLFTDPRIFGLR